jgi:hypothetical protein
MLVVVPAAPAQALITPNCPWQTKLDPNTTNVAFPDQFANYFTMIWPLAGTTSLTIKGRYPHARYTSFTTYTSQTQAVDGVNDLHILPKDGKPADNPFVPGNQRNTEGAVRDYQVEVINGQRPAGEQFNKVYTTDANGSHSNRALYIVIYRTYRPDVGLDPGGGEPLPAVTVNPTSGPSFDIPSSGCSTMADPDLGFNGILTNTTLPTVLPGQAGCYPGVNPPAWHKFTNVATAEIQGTSNQCLMANDPQSSITPVTDQTIPAGGFLENLDNKYISTILNVDTFGTVLMIESRVPTTPNTYQEPGTNHGATIMPAPATQLRYWSMCSNEGLSTRFYACVMDDGLARLDASGDYCLVVTRVGADRPRNADANHHVNWLPFGVLHDNVLIERNMLPDPSFTQAIQNVQPGNEKPGLGAYYPTASYVSVAQFERDGCPGFTALTAFGTLPADLPEAPLAALPLLIGLLLAVGVAWRARRVAGAA